MTESTDPFADLRPFASERTERWAQRWTLVIDEITRRSEIMGLDSAIGSVCDDLRAGRL